MYQKHPLKVNWTTTPVSIIYSRLLYVLCDQVSDSILPMSLQLWQILLWSMLDNLMMRTGTLQMVSWTPSGARVPIPVIILECGTDQATIEHSLPRKLTPCMCSTFQGRWVSIEQQAFLAMKEYFSVIFLMRTGSTTHSMWVCTGHQLTTTFVSKR